MISTGVGSEVGAAPNSAYVIDGPWAEFGCAEVVYRLSPWVKGPAERFQHPTSNRARELQHAQRAAWAAISEPREHE